MTLRERIDGLSGWIAFGTLVAAVVGYFVYERMHDAYWMSIENAKFESLEAGNEQLRRDISDLKVYVADQLGHHRGEHDARPRFDDAREGE